MSAELSSLLLALSQLVDRAGEGGFNVNVSLCDAKEVVELKQQLNDLRQENETLLRRVNAAEFQARCDSVICMRVIDFCRDNGIKIPRKLYDGLDSFK